MKILSLDWETSIGHTIHGPGFRDRNNDIITQIHADHPDRVVVQHCADGYNRRLSSSAALAMANSDLIVGHNLAFDLSYIWHDPTFQSYIQNGGKIWDTQVAEYLLTGQQHTFSSLAELQLKYLGEKEKPSRISWLYKKGIGADKIVQAKDRCPRLFALYEFYCKSDGRTPLLIWKAQYTRAKAEGMLPIIELYNDYLLSIINMTCTGIKIDVAATERTFQDFNIKYLTYLQEAHNILKQVWTDERLPTFNINSPVHKSAVLFGGNIPIDVIVDAGFYKNGKKKTKKGVQLLPVKGFALPLGLTSKTKKEGVYSTDDSVMKAIALKTTSNEIKEYCELQKKAMMHKKAANTYCKAFLDRHVDGILYPNFNNTLTQTGRLSSSEPNCVSSDTEVLTQRGWVFFPELRDSDLVYQVDPATEKGLFTKPKTIYKIPNHNGSMVCVRSEAGEFLYTEGHRILSYNREGTKQFTEEAGEWLSNWGSEATIIDRKILRSSYREGGIKLSLEEKNVLELAVVCQAEGYYRPKKTKEDFFMVKVKSARKKHQLRELFGITLKDTNWCLHTDIPVTMVSDWVDENKHFNVEKILNLCKEDLVWFLKCVHRWDGDYTRECAYGQKLSKRKQALDVVQAAACLVGQSTSWYNHPTKDFAVVNFNSNTMRFQSRTEIFEVSYNDYVYCVEVPSEYFLIRRNGSVIVTGNCQNISKRNEFGKVLHSLFIAPEGWTCCQIDFSQLEIWVLAWLSNDLQLIEDLQNGVDLHVKRLQYYNDKTYEELFKLCKIDKDPYWDKQRTYAKTVSYQMAYGAQPKKVAESTGLDLSVVETIFAKEAETYSDTAALAVQVQESIKRTATFSGSIDIPRSNKGKNILGGVELLPVFDNYGNVCYTNQEIRKVGYWTSPTGKKYHFLDSGRMTRNGLQRGFSFTQPKNYPMQGSAADIQGMTTAALLPMLLKKKDKIKMINEIHDSKAFYIRNDVLKTAITCLVNIIEDVPKIMQERFGIKVPFKFPIDVEIGPNFGNMEKVQIERDNESKCITVHLE